MRLLLDTHVWLWMSESPERIAQSVLVALDSQETECILSAAVAYEISLKVALGKLTLPAPARDWLRERAELLQAQPLAISLEHAWTAASLPMHHRDPFDRLLVAQAMVEGVTLVTADRALEPYGVSLLWAAR